MSNWISKLKRKKHLMMSFWR